MDRPIDLFGSAMLEWPKGSARWLALERLRRNGVRITGREGGSTPIVAFYTDPDFHRAAMVLRLRSGRVQVKRFGRLKPAEVAFLHGLASQVPSPPK